METTITFDLDKKTYPLRSGAMVGKHMTHLGVACGRITKAVDKGDFVTVFCKLDKCCEKFIKRGGLCEKNKILAFDCRA